VEVFGVCVEVQQAGDDFAFRRVVGDVFERLDAVGRIVVGWVLRRRMMEPSCCGTSMASPSLYSTLMDSREGQKSRRLTARCGRARSRSSW